MGEGRKVEKEEEGEDIILPKAKKSFASSFRLFFKSLGPGLVTGGSDNMRLVLQPIRKQEHNLDMDCYGWL